MFFISVSHFRTKSNCKPSAFHLKLLEKTHLGLRGTMLSNPPQLTPWYIGHWAALRTPSSKCFYQDENEIMWNQYHTVKLLPLKIILPGPTYSWPGVHSSKTPALNTCIGYYLTSFLNNIRGTSTFSPRQLFMIPSLLLQMFRSDMQPKRSRDGKARGRRVVNSCWAMFSRQSWLKSNFSP